MWGKSKKLVVLLDLLVVDIVLKERKEIFEAHGAEIAFRAVPWRQRAGLHVAVAYHYHVRDLLHLGVAYLAARLLVSLVHFHTVAEGLELLLDAVRVPVGPVRNRQYLYLHRRQPHQSYMISMNELSNHDHSRFLTRTNRMVGRTASLGPEKASENVNKAVFKEAVVMQFTWPGAPTIYYGDEAGVCGFTDPDNRRTYPWGSEDKELIAFHRDIIKMHNENQVFRTGSYKPLYSEHNILSYARFTREDSAVVIINNSEDEKRVRISLVEAGFSYDDDVEQIMVTFENGYSTDKLGYHLKNGWLDIGLRKTSAVVLRRLRW